MCVPLLRERTELMRACVRVLCACVSVCLCLV